MALDRTGKRGRWQAARASESAYNTRLRGVAKVIDTIIKGYLSADQLVTAMDAMRIKASLDKYADLILPWARSVAGYMLADVARRNVKQWEDNSKEMGRALRAEIQQAPTGMLLSALQADQVELITSLPKVAAQRVHDLTQQALIDSRRASDIAKDVLKTGEVTKARATLIARTEVSRAQSNLTQARAMFAGSQGYVWRTSKDMDVRDTHKAMEGVYVPWDTPPKTDKNLDPYHAGCGPNCRCWAEPVLPDLD
jgi:SPP1 gp7 family putative phage head morphogenesis protein